MGKGGGQRKSESALAPSRESGDAIAKNSVAQSPNVRRNCPWTEAEHKLFLLGLEEYGRGNWRDIAARYVSTRTPTQVASHAQKYFLREGLPASRREKRRPSIHDIRSATEATAMTADERAKLRNSLQLLNRESMESIDTSALEGGLGRAGFRHSPGGAVARNYSKTHETGSSGEVSTSAADKNVCSSKRESMSEWPLSHKESSDGFRSDGFPERACEEDANPHAASGGVGGVYHSDWQTSSLFAPAKLPPDGMSGGNPVFDAADLGDKGGVVLRPSTSFDMMASGSGSVLMYNAVSGASVPEHSTLQPMQLQIPGGHAFTDFLAPQQQVNPNQNLAPMGSNIAAGVPVQAGPHDPGTRVGMPAEFPAAYPIRFMEDPQDRLYEEEQQQQMHNMACVAQPQPGAFTQTAGARGGLRSFQQPSTFPPTAVHAHPGLVEQSNRGLQPQDPAPERFSMSPTNRNNSPIGGSAAQGAGGVGTGSPVATMHGGSCIVVPGGISAALTQGGMMDRSQSQACTHLGGGPALDLYATSSLPVVPSERNPQFHQDTYNQAMMHCSQVPPEGMFCGSAGHGNNGGGGDVPFSCCPSVDDFRGLALGSSASAEFLTQDNDPLLTNIPDFDQEMM